MDKGEALGRLGGGHFQDILADALVKVSEEVVATGKEGSVTVTLKVTKPKGAADNMVTVQDSIRLTLPRRESLGAYFYLGNGAFHQNDPRQLQMDIGSGVTLDDLGIESRKVEE